MIQGDDGAGGSQVNQMTSPGVESDVTETAIPMNTPGVVTTMDIDELARTFDAVVANVRSAYLGRDLTVRLSLCCLMAEGHLLVEDHPGVGKTTLAKALARSLGLASGGFR